MIPALPFPAKVAGEDLEGSFIQTHEFCLRCVNRECEKAPPAEARALCHRGLAYRNIRGQVLVYGVAISDDPTIGPQQRKAIKKAGRQTAKGVHFRAACEAVDRFFENRENIAQEERNAELDQFRATREYLGDLAGLLAPQIESALGQFHDYRALAGKVRMNIESYLDQKDPGEQLAAQLSNAPHEIVAAYWSAVLMIDKLDTASFLLNPDKILEQVDAPFRFHGAYAKYAKIYQREFEAKKVRLVQTGESYAKVHSNSLAISALPLNLLDNALKYAPSGTEVVVHFEDHEDAIEFTMTSIGPKIDDDERQRIFEPFYRSRAAQKASTEGLGFGLAICRLVANRIGTRIDVHQVAEQAHPLGYQTTFSVSIPNSRQ